MMHNLMNKWMNIHIYLSIVLILCHYNSLQLIMYNIVLSGLRSRKSMAIMAISDGHVWFQICRSCVFGQQHLLLQALDRANVRCSRVANGRREWAWLKSMMFSPRKSKPESIDFPIIWGLPVKLPFKSIHWIHWCFATEPNPMGLDKTMCVCLSALSCFHRCIYIYYIHRKSPFLIGGKGK